MSTLLRKSQQLLDDTREQLQQIDEAYGWAAYLYHREIARRDPKRQAMAHNIIDVLEDTERRLSAIKDTAQMIATKADAPVGAMHTYHRFKEKEWNREIDRLQEEERRLNRAVFREIHDEFASALGDERTQRIMPYDLAESDTTEKVESVIATHKEAKPKAVVLDFKKPKKDSGESRGFSPMHMASHTKKSMALDTHHHVSKQHKKRAAG